MEDLLYSISPLKARLVYEWKHCLSSESSLLSSVLLRLHAGIAVQEDF